MVDYNSAKNKGLECKHIIKPLRDKLAPYGEILAGLANPVSRDKYFPDMSKNQFIDYVKEQVI